MLQGFPLGTKKVEDASDGPVVSVGVEVAAVMHHSQ
jgi:hypothetical protein